MFPRIKPYFAINVVIVPVYTSQVIMYSKIVIIIQLYFKVSTNNAS